MGSPREQKCLQIRGTQCAGLEVRESTQVFLLSQGAKDAWDWDPILNISVFVLEASVLLRDWTTL